MLIKTLGLGGAERHVVDLSRAFVERGHSVTVVFLMLPKPNLHAELTAAGVTVHRLTGRTKLGQLQQLSLIIQTERPNIVHSHSPALKILARVLRPFLGFRLVSTHHNVFMRHSFAQRVIERLLHWLDDVQISCSDEVAVEAARKRGFDVHLGGLDVSEGQEARFDLITMNHVIEHLHDPLDDLAACYRLLKPGGRIWIETPNIQSYGHKSFGANWRRLETPRHLVLFSRKTLYRALSNAGFGAIRQKPDRNVYRGMYTKSHAMRSGERPDSKTELPLPLDLMARLARLSGAIAPKRREFLTFTAEKE